MDLGAQQESSLTMPIPMNYGSVHNSSKFRMLGGPAINGPLHMSSGGPPRAPLAAPPAPPPASQPSAEDLTRTRLTSSTPVPGGAAASAPSASKHMIVPAVGPSAGGLTPSFASKMPIKYRECLKNHAASIGGYALDGCGEFMPSGEEGSLEVLKCAACGCHRNFHRREVEGELQSGGCGFCYNPRSGLMNDSKRRFTPLAALPPHTPLALPPSPAVGLGALPRTISQQAALPLHTLHSSPDAATVAGDDHHHHPQYLHAPDHSMMGMHHHHFAHSSSSMKKRFRTKFRSDQKDKMFGFAEKLGWRIQKHDEAAVHQFCADLGVKHHVFKVWMHNNKHTFGKKISPNEGGVAYVDNGGSSPTTSSGMQP